MNPLPQQQALPPPSEPPPIPSNVQQQQQQQQPPQPTSILERLRERVSRELMPDPVEEMQRRARTWAAGIGSVRGGTLFEGLAAGQQAVDRQRQQEEQARTGRLQQMEQQALREAEQNLRERQFEYDRSPNPQNQLRLAQAREIYNEIAQGRRPAFVQGTDPATRNLILFDPASGRRVDTGMRPVQELRNQPRALGAADFARLRDRATAAALREFPSIQGVTDPPARVEQRNTRTNQLFEEYVRAEETARAMPTGGSPSTGTPGTPAAQSGAGNRPLIRDTYIPPNERR